MSPSGISMFYCAFDLLTAKTETIDHSDTSKKYFTSANFTPNNNLIVVDFSRLTNKINYWDVDNLDNYYPLKFLNNFINDISKPIIRDGREHIEYVPTQIITEYLRFLFAQSFCPNIKIDGIIFPSSKNKGHNSCALFMNHNESLEKLTFHQTSLKTEEIMA